MTIRKGEDWGRREAVPEGLVIAWDDADLHRLLNREDRPTAVGLLAGDLARTLGAPGRTALRAGDEATVVTVDLGVARSDAGEHRFAANAVARRSWWRGPLVGVFNAQYRGRWDVAPRSHPNDGWLDVVLVEAAMSPRQRWLARGRLPAGGYLPHPAIRTRRVHDAEWEFERALDLWLDGVEIGRTGHLSVSVIPDALVVYV